MSPFRAEGRKIHLLLRGLCHAEGDSRALGAQIMAPLSHTTSDFLLYRQLGPSSFLRPRTLQCPNKFPCPLLQPSPLPFSSLTSQWPLLSFFCVCTCIRVCVIHMHLSFETGSLIGLELYTWARLAGPSLQGSACLSFPFHHC